MDYKKVSSESNNKSERIMEGIAIWTSFYRANPHRFCKDYLNINLKLFQQLLIFMMNLSTHFVFIAARGLGKSFLCAVFCVVRCILYPGTKITIAAKTRNQSINILDEKILKILYQKSSNLRAEIESWKIANDKAEIIFKNGSYIKVVTASDNSRGARANILVCDEFRMIDKTTIDIVLKKFLGDPRHPGYLDDPKYAHLQERNKEIYLSSAWYMAHWSWEKCKDYFSMMCDTTKRYFCCCFPYQMSIKEGILMKSQVEDEMSEGSFSELTFKMEMCADWIGVTEGGLFNFDNINRSRVLRDPVYAPCITIDSGRSKIPSKKNGEIRIMTVDIALMNSKKRDNDATSIFVNFLIPNKNGKCVSNFVYTENQEGMSAPDLALKIRRYVDYFDCDYVGLDCKGLGLPIADLIMHDIYDAEYGIVYPAITCCNNDEIAERCPENKTAQKKLWAIMATANFNNDVVVALRSGFEQGKIRMLMSEYDCENVLITNFKGYNKLSPSEKAALKMPYINTGLAVNELINLEYEINNSSIKVKEKPGCRKDRYSSMSYNYFIAQKIERDIEKKNTSNNKIMFNFRSPIIKKGGL